MRIDIDRSLVLKIYSLARQAERSIDFALASAKQWELFRQYYDETRLHRLCDLIHLLEAMAPTPLDLISRDQIPGITLSWAFFYPFRWLRNQFLVKWRFSDRELGYIVHVLRNFLHATGHAVQPDPKKLVQLRMDLYAVEYMIEMKLIGVSALQKANQIEHFCKADHAVSFTMEEVCA